MEARVLQRQTLWLGGYRLVRMAHPRYIRAALSLHLAKSLKMLSQSLNAYDLEALFLKDFAFCSYVYRFLGAVRNDSFWDNVSLQSYCSIASEFYEYEEYGHVVTPASIGKLLPTVNVFGKVEQESV